MMQIKNKIAIVGVIGLLAVGGTVLGDATRDDVSVAKIQEKYDTSEIKTKYVLNEAKLVKTDIKNTELDKYKSEPKDEIEVTVGDNDPVAVKGIFGATTDEKEFKPNIELKRWNEVSFKLKPKGLENVATKDKTLTFEGNKIKFATPKISFEMYDYTENEGGYKYIWYLNEKPATNKIEFDIETQGLDFFYQPPLTEEFKNGYSEKFQKEIVVTETQVKDLDGNVLVERPENVVGSYAVYHSSKGGMVDANGKSYGTGKAFHIFRPHIIDANGAETWGELHIENGIYSVEIPQEFLDKAVYPIKSNDTFGYTTEGLTHKSSADTNDSDGSIFTGVSGTATSISVYGYQGSYWRFAIYLHSDLSRVVSTATSNVGAGGSDSWKTLTIADTSISAVSYLLAVGGNNYYYLQYDAGDANQGHNSSSGFEVYTQVSPFTVAVHSTNKYSIYATYTPSGGGGSTVDNTTINISDE